MTYFRVGPEIHKSEDFRSFSKKFSMGPGDLVLTLRILYDEFMQAGECGAQFLCIEDFGVGEPTVEMINEIVQSQRGRMYKRVFGVGGGSVMDVSKILSLQAVEDVADFFERTVPAVRAKELVIVPTTCGTGSEVTNISVVRMDSKGGKFGLQDDALYADHAVLIQELVSGLPFEVFACSSIDALIHAIESYVSPKANSYSNAFAKMAIETILRGYKQIVSNERACREDLLDSFMTASNYAGIAFGNAGVGAVHALSFPLGGIYKVPHGEANYLFFIEVFRTYNRLNPEGKIKEINRMLADILELSSDADVYSELEALLNQLIKRKRLREYGMAVEETNTFADDVIRFQQRLLKNNYTELSRSEISAIYKKLY